jgi:hypothetical protein
LYNDPIARGVKTRDESKDFYSSSFSANKMKLVVLGCDSLDTLEAWVTGIFAEVPNKGLGRKSWLASMCDKAELALRSSFLLSDAIKSDANICSTSPPLQRSNPFKPYLHAPKTRSM